ncbi:MAG: hypothetical protein FWF78_05090 [Defluviitaleaceae bacterium]|nr:hypothetical protein [Defluviitaleaceae bacterium]
MKGKAYDLGRLSASGNFDIGVSTRFYYNTQDYFDALSEFAEGYARDLGNYTPAFVVNSDLDRDEFMKECFIIRADFIRMGMTNLLETLVVMEDAAISRNMKEFSDGQVRYHATLKINQSEIKAAER